MKIRCSSLGKIMTRPRSEKDGVKLSKTAMSYIKEIAKQDFYGYEPTLENKYLLKGRAVEDESINLYNSVFFTMASKNTERKENDFLTGECDIDLVNPFDENDAKIVDIKSSWSLETFPALTEDIDAKDYEMQLRGYMMLWNRMSSELAFCMVSTPEELLKDWDSDAVHKVDEIDPSARVTVQRFERDFEIEKEIETRCKLAQVFYNDYIVKLTNKNK